MPLPKKVKAFKKRKIIPKSSATDDEDNGVLGRIKPIGFGEDDGIKLMLYGRSGTGKTTLWGTFPGKTLAVLCSGSDTPGELRSIDTPENRGRIDSVVLRKGEELVEVTKMLRESPGEYRNVVLDHASGYADLLLRDILGLDEDIVQKSFGMASQQDYGQMSVQFKTYLRGLIGLSQNVVIIAHERTFGEREGADSEAMTEGVEQTVGAALTPSLTNWMNGAMDYLARTFVRQQVITRWKKVKIKDKVKKMAEKTATDKVEYCLRVGGSPTYQTKFRVPGGIAESVVVDPTYDKVMALIRGEAFAADETSETESGE